MDAIRLELPVDHTVVLSQIVNAHDSGAILYWLMEPPVFLDHKWHDRMEANPDEFKAWSWRLVEDDGSDTGAVHELTYAKMLFGMQKMAQDTLLGKYRNPYTNIIKVIQGKDYGDASFADDVIQYALFGKIIFG